MKLSDQCVVHHIVHPSNLQSHGIDETRNQNHFGDCFWKGMDRWQRTKPQTGYILPTSETLSYRQTHHRWRHNWACIQIHFFFFFFLSSRLQTHWKPISQPLHVYLKGEKKYSWQCFSNHRGCWVCTNTQIIEHSDGLEALHHYLQQRPTADIVVELTSWTEQYHLLPGETLQTNQRERFLLPTLLELSWAFGRREVCVFNWKVRGWPLFFLDWYSKVLTSTGIWLLLIPVIKLSLRYSNSRDSIFLIWKSPLAVYTRQSTEKPVTETFSLRLTVSKAEEDLQQWWCFWSPS